MFRVGLGFLPLKRSAAKHRLDAEALLGDASGAERRNLSPNHRYADDLGAIFAERVHERQVDFEAIRRLVGEAGQRERLEESRRVLPNGLARSDDQLVRESE